MAEIGVLNLTIHDNSNEAAKGLVNLADALGRIRTAVGSDTLGLEKIRTQINKFASGIAKTKNTVGVLKTITDFGKAIDKLKNVGESLNIDPNGSLKKLNDSIGNGAGLKAAASAMNAYARAVAAVKVAMGNSPLQGGYSYGAEEKPKEHKSLLKLNLQQFAGRGSGTTEGLAEVQSTVQQATEAFKYSTDAINQTTDAQIKLNEAGRAYAGTVTIFDDAEKTYKQMYVDLGMTEESLKKAIDWTQVPSSGKNGVFASIAEEVEYLKHKIDDEIVSQQQWLSINEAATKQLSYGGGSKSVKELQFDKKYSEEGYYAALEAEQKYKDALVDLSGYMNEYVANAKKVIQENNAQSESMEKVASSTQKANDAMANSTGAVHNVLSGTQATTIPEPAQRSPWTAEDVSNLVNYYSQVELLEMKMQGMQSALAADIEANKLDTQQIADRTMAIQNLRDRIEELNKRQEGATGSSKDMRKALDDLFATSKKSSLEKLISQFARMAKMRAIRYIIREIAKGFKEGVQNVYEYSKAIGSSFAPSMDAAASSLAQMKNSLGAAIAPAIQAIIPLLQTVISWFITGINYINQFFALLNGQKTWTRALPQTTTAFKNQEKAAKSAGAAIKDLLADWDELNIIQSENSGGGTGTGTTPAEDYLHMFEEVGTFDNKIKDIVNFIKDNFETIKDVAIGIGAALLAWKVAGAIYDVLKLVNTLKGGIIMSVVGFTLSAMAGASLANEGWSAKTVLETVGGLAASALGGSWIGAALATKLGFAATGGAILGAITGLAIGVGFMIHWFKVQTIENAYGTLTDDADTIKDNVMKYFNPEAEALVNVANARLKDEADAEKKVGDALATLNKDYPVSISVTTEEALDKLKLDVDNLVLETKNLILQRKQNTRSLVLNSKQFDDAESFIKFSDMQWDATAKYIEDLGEKMGKLISDGITNGAELDGLKEKLTNIVRAATYGQRSGEYAGKASLAGATLRSAGYTKSTVGSYIDTFLNERQAYQNQATADALAQQAELKALWATLEERYNQGDKTVTKEDIMYAEEEYKKFSVEKEVQRLMNLYLGEGDKIFAQDLFEGLSKVMEQTKDLWTVKGMRSNIEQFADNMLGQDAVTYAKDLRSQLIKTIAEGTGQDAGKLTQLFDMTGINPLDLFGKDFADNIRGKIAETLGSSNFTQAEKEAIARSFGLGDIFSESVHKDTVEEIKQKIRDELIRTGKGMQNDEFADFLFGLDKQYIDSYVDEAIEEVERELEKAMDYKQFDTVTEAITKAMEDGLTDFEISNIMDHFNMSPSDFNKLLKDLGYTHTSIEGPNAKPYNGGSEQPSFVNTNGTAMTESDFATSVASGTKSGNAEQNMILDGIQRGIDSLAKQPIIVNIGPSSRLGFATAAATVMASRISGHT